MTSKEIGEQLNVSKTTVLNHLKKYNADKTPIPQPEKIKKKNTKKNIPLNEIIELHNLGMKDREIAEYFGCDRSNITIRLNKAGIINRKSKIDDIALRNRISESLKGKFIGNKNPNYKGYIDEKTIARGLFKTLSKKVIRERKYTCQICGQHGGNLETHHIKPFNIILKEFLENAYSGNIENFVTELSQWPEFWDENNLLLTCKKCHHNIHYTDNPDLSPYRWERATTIENIEQKPILFEEVSRVESSDSKCKGT